jgi:dephospho-CoA kinase
MLNELGVRTIDADDIVHSLIPEEERRRLAKTVFKDEAARKALEKRIHPEVRRRIDGALAADLSAVAVIPLLFEVKWDAEYDIICAVVSSRENQLDRMMKNRGMGRDEAEARLAAQMDAREKAARSHYVIENDGTADDLRREAGKFVSWLRSKRNV